MSEVKKQKFEVKVHFDQNAGIHRRDVFIDDKLFDYEVDQESLIKAKSLGTAYYVATQRDIQKHFLECLSDFLGRPVTSADVMEAIQSGWI